MKKIVRYVLGCCLLLVGHAGMSQQVFNVQAFGAKGDGKSNDAAAFQKAIDACHKAGGGRVLVPASKTF